MPKYFPYGSRMGSFEDFLRTGYQGYKVATRKRSGSPYHGSKGRRGSYGLGGTKRRKYGGTKPNVVRQAANRSKRKTTGRSKVKSIQHRKRKVYVSPRLRKKIKKVIKGQEIRGTYRTVRQGTIGTYTTQAADVEYILQDQGGYQNGIATIKIPNDLSSNTQWWWQQPNIGNDSRSNGGEFQFFTPMKILDAASILWNKKGINADYTAQLDNFNSSHVVLTGAPVSSGTRYDMGIVGLKIHVINTYVKMIVKNSTQRSFVLGFYKCVPATAYPDSLPMDAFKSALEEEHDGANTSIIAASGTFAKPVDNLFVMPQCEPNLLKSFRSQWKYEKVNIKMEPGETTTLFMQGPKDYTIDYDKLKFGENDKQHFANKKTSMALMISVLPDLVFATDNVDIDGNSGRYIPATSALNKVVDPISIEYEETFHLGMPELAGFQQPAADAGTAQQPLNNRLPRLAFGNFVSDHTVSLQPVYKAYDEQNPAIAIDVDSDN